MNGSAGMNLTGSAGDPARIRTRSVPARAEPGPPNDSGAADRKERVLRRSTGQEPPFPVVARLPRVIDGPGMSADPSEKIRRGERRRAID